MNENNLLNSRWPQFCRKSLATVLSLALATAFLSQAASAAQEQRMGASPASISSKGESGAIEFAPQINATMGKSTLLKLPSAVTRISVGDKDVADVVLLNPKEVYLLGKKVGTTNIMLWSKSGQSTVVDVNVGMDIAALQGKLQLLLPGEKNIKVSSAADSLVLTGTVSDAVKVDKAVALAEAYVSQNSGSSSGSGSGQNKKVVNFLQAGAPQQVMLEVKIAEINRTMAEKLGLNFARQFTTGGGAWTKTISGIIGGGPANYNQTYNATQKIAPVTVLEGDVDTTVLGGTGSGALQQTATNLNTQDFTSWLIDAQKKDGLVKILAEPNIVAISGQEGSFLAGGEFLIPVPQANGTMSLESKQFGVGLKFTPTVLEADRINIKVSPEVTDLVGFSNVATTGLGATVLVPTLTTRRISTTVQLREGQSLAIGGLLSDNFREQVARFPLLGEIPILGALFRSSEFQKNKTELLVVVTPRLVKPLQPDYRLPTDGFIEPSRSEFFFEGKMEGSPQEPVSAEEAPKAESQPAAAATASDGFQMK